MKFVIIKSCFDDVFTYLMCEDNEEHLQYLYLKDDAENEINQIVDVVYGHNKDTLKNLKIKYPKLIV